MRWPEDWGTRTAIMGVINLTPDSFSDGGRFNHLSLAMAEASRQISCGIDCLDLGAQSTRPNANEIGTEEELKRLLPTLRAIRTAHPNILISVDTFIAAVAAEALEAGANWINDVSGGRRDPAMLPLIAQAQCPFVLMHSRGDSRTMDHCTDYGEKGVIQAVIDELQDATDLAVKAGVNDEQLIWDPGLGFAKTTEQNLALLQKLETLVAHGIPILLGPSRKRFIGDVLNESRPERRLWGTAAVCCRAVDAGVAVLRVHDVEPIHQLVTMASAIGANR